MADIIYNSFKKQLLNAGVNFGTSDINVMLVSSSYTPNEDDDDFQDDVTGEVSGIGYTSGGATLTGGTVTQDNTDNEAVYDADDVTWGTSSVTARGAVLYKNTGVGSTSPLIAYIDFGSDQTSSSGNFTIQWNTEGIINLGG
jgi:hypothetical protein